MAAALTITHSLVPPHPAPAAAAQLLGARPRPDDSLRHRGLHSHGDRRRDLLRRWIARRIFVPVPEIAASAGAPRRRAPAPPVPLVVLLLLLPVLLIFGATVASLRKLPFRALPCFLGHPFTALTITALVAIYLLRHPPRAHRDQAAKMATESLAPMGALLCIMGGGGAFKQVIVDSGVGATLGKLLITSAISPLIVVYLVAAAMRMAQGSATVAIITAAGIVAPMVKGIPGYSPDMLVLALCCGGTAFSHVNDSGFWLVNQYFGMTVPQTSEVVDGDEGGIVAGRARGRDARARAIDRGELCSGQMTCPARDGNRRVNRPVERKWWEISFGRPRENR